MKNRWFEEQPSVQKIRDELTTQDIRLREEISQNHSRISNHTQFGQRQSQFKSEVKSPLQDEDKKKSSRFYHEKQNESLWIRSTPLSSSHKRGEVKINSLVYRSRLERNKSCSSQKKNKLCVSLSMKGKVLQSKDSLTKLQGKAKLKKAMFGDEKENWQDDRCFEVKLDNKVKQTTGLRSQGNFVKIKQPDFHSRHPLRPQGRFNGSCLSGVIARRTIQIQN